MSTASPLLPSSPEAERDGCESPLPSGRCATLYLLTAVSAIGGFLFGYDTGVVSGAMVLVRKEFHLTDTWHELIVSATVGAAWLLSLVAGPLADRLGRRPVILAASAAFCSGALLAALAGSRETLLAGRLALGVGIGLASCTVPVLIAEAAPADARGVLTTVNIAFTTGGQLAAAILCGALASAAGGWRWMMGVAALPAAVQLPALLALPESPRFLVSRGRRREAAAALTRLRPAGFPVRRELARVAAQCARESRVRRSAGGTGALLRRPAVRRALLLGCGLQIFQQLAGINTVMYYSASIIQMAGVRDVSAAIWLAAIPAAVNFGGTLVGLVLVERVGRRPLTLTSLLGTAAALALLAAGFWLNAAQSPPVIGPPDTPPQCHTSNCASCQAAGCGFCFIETPTGPANGSCLPLTIGNASVPPPLCRDTADVWTSDWCPTPHAWLPVLGLCLYLAAFAPGMGPMPWTINAEIYPAWARGTGSGLAASCNWLANLAVSLSFLSLVATVGRPVTFLLYAGVAFVGWLLLLRWLPETRGVPLENMATLFGGGDDEPPLLDGDLSDDDVLLGDDTSPETRHRPTAANSGPTPGQSR